MRLVSLEIKGFKSFADRTIINFGEDVIGVVGSNGCGKSNIVDAIRWVLGEQKTKQLRSESMTSVIFNGTKARKAAGMAEVTLVFDNDKGVLPMEYQQVSIKRTLFKDGSSAYYLNGVKCRLKDIANLLSDTGMGSDSYAIIALGMVDDLLADKENSRSKLFEQAAGVSKYKIRKKETLSKLKSTEADLERVEDLVFEIEKNLKSLEKQAKRAKAYFELKDEYRKFSLELSYFKIASCKADYKTLDNQITTESENKKTAEKAIQALEKTVEKSQSGTLQKEQQLAQAQRQLSSLIGKIKGKENDSKMLTQKTLFIQQSTTQLDERIAQNKKRLTQTEEQIDNQSERLDKAFEAGKTVSSDLADAKIALEKVRQLHGNTKAQLEEFVMEQKKLDNALFQLEKEQAVLQNQQESAQRNVDRIQENIATRSTEIKAITAESVQLQKLQKTEEHTLQQLKDKEEKRKVDLEKNNQQLDDASEQLAQTARQLDSKNNEFKLLKSLVENMEGFSESIKFLSKNKTWADNAPLVSDLFYCEPTYRTAIENYLEEYLSYFVVQNFAEALKAIELLEANKKGKANFFLLEQFPENSTTAATEEGIAAIDVVQFDAPYRALAQHLLSNVYITEKPLAQEQLTDGKIWLTLDGKFIQRPFATKGGYVGAFEGKKIGRKKNLELLEKQIETLTVTVTKWQQEVQDLKRAQQQLRQANYQREIQQLEQQLNKIIRQAVAIQSKIDSFEQFRTENLTLIESYQTQTQKQAERQQLIGTELQALQQQKNTLQRDMADKGSAVQEIASQMSETSSAYNRMHIEQVKQQNTIAAVEKELDYSHQQYKELRDQYKTDQKLLEESGGNLSETEEEIKQVNVQLAEWYELKKDYQNAQTIAEKEFFEVRGNATQAEKELREVQRNYNQLVQLIAKLEGKFNEVKLQLTTIAERLNVEFEVKMNDLINESPNPEYEESVLESNVNQLRTRLQNYGSINPMAIEAYDEIQERYEVIRKQRADLDDAKKNLLDTIAEIETKATKQFMKAFNQVREHFIEVFRSLFLEDDTCDLLLTNPETPLESGIDIIAKPKGKRPLSINQLSGGEKTLTATALLFSLYLLKPAPFCIFDEVDAPLDDANIAKFNNIVKDFSKNSQFIIVTHNKKTMEAVDIMYGVTMVQGVSRVVPVDFRALETVT